MMKTKLSLLLTAAATFAFGSASALAAPLTFNFSFTGSTLSASGTLTANTTGTAGVYQVVGITGVFGGFNIDSLDPVGTYDINSLPDNDNLLYYPLGSQGYFDDGGISFKANGTDYSIYNGTAAGASYQLIGGVNGNLLDSNITTLRVVQTGLAPEPGSLVLLGTGALGLVGVARRRITA